MQKTESPTQGLNLSTKVHIHAVHHTCDIFSLQVASSFMMVCALSLASLSAPSSRSLCSFSVLASQRRFERCILARVKSSSEISVELSTARRRSSDFDPVVPRELVASLTSRNKVLNISCVFLRSSWVLSFSSSSSWDFESTDCCTCTKYHNITIPTV